MLTLNEQEETVTDKIISAIADYIQIEPLQVAPAPVLSFLGLEIRQHMFHAWQEQAAKLEQSEITKEEYDQWRYKYPELDTSKHWAKVPSQAVSDMLMEEFQKIEKEEKKTAKKKKQK